MPAPITLVDYRNRDHIALRDEIALGAADTLDGENAAHFLDRANHTGLEPLDAITPSPTDDQFLATRAGVVLWDGILAGDVPDLDATKITTGQFADGRISQSSVTQHQGAFSLDASQITSGVLDIGRIPTDLRGHGIVQRQATAPTGDVDGELWQDSDDDVLYVWDGAAWVASTAAAGDHALVGSSHTASGLTAGQVVRASGSTTFAWAALNFSDLGGSIGDGQVPQSAVTQHQAALSIGHTQLTYSGLTAGHVLRASGATAASFAALQVGDLPSHTHAASQVTAGTFPSGGHTFAGAVTMQSTLDLDGTSGSTAGTITLTQPGSSPSGSEVTISSPAGNPGLIIKEGDGAGGVIRRWDMWVTEGDFHLFDNTGNQDALTIASGGAAETAGGRWVFRGDAVAGLSTAAGTHVGYTVSTDSSFLIAWQQSDNSYHKLDIRGNPIAFSRGDLWMEAGKKFFLDGGVDTYIYESSANVVLLNAGGVNVQNWTPTQVYFYRDVKIDPGKKLYLDGGGDTYIHHTTADRIDFVAGAGTRMDIGTGVITARVPIRPVSNNQHVLGTDTLRWSTIYGVDLDLSGDGVIGGVLEVGGRVTSKSGLGQFEMYDTTTAIGSGDVIGQINWRGEDNSPGVGALIVGRAAGTWTGSTGVRPMQLEFWTGSDSSGITNWMILEKGGQLAFKEGSEPATRTDFAHIYARTLVGGGNAEMFVRDEAGIETQLSAHDPLTREWYHHDYDWLTGKERTVWMERFVQDVIDVLGLPKEAYYQERMRFAA